MNIYKTFGDVELNFESLENGEVVYIGHHDGQEIRVSYDVSDTKSWELSIFKTATIFELLWTTEEEFDEFWVDYGYDQMDIEDFWLQIKVS